MKMLLIHKLATPRRPETSKPSSFGTQIWEYTLRAINDYPDQIRGMEFSVIGLVDCDLGDLTPELQHVLGWNLASGRGRVVRMRS